MSPSNKLDLQEHIASPAKKQSYVNQMFATIAPRYDLVTTLLSYGQDKRWKRRLVAMADVHPHHQVLDLACGTGDITFLLTKQLDGRGKVTGVDITPEMVERARCKASHERRVQFETGDICQLNFPDASFHRITVGYGMRNVPEIPRLLVEVFRLLKPGRTLSLIGFRKAGGPVVSEGLSWLLEHDRIHAGLALASRPRHLWLYRRIDQALSRTEWRP